MFQREDDDLQDIVEEVGHLCTRRWYVERSCEIVTYWTAPYHFCDEVEDREAEACLLEKVHQILGRGVPELFMDAHYQPFFSSALVA